MVESLHPNYAFVLHFARQQAGERMLDYGCGDGSVVVAALKQGLDASGVEEFYGGGVGDRERVAAHGLLGDRVREMYSGVIPFEDDSFDVVWHNQVFEHVADLPQAIGEIARVMKPQGVLLSLFPSRGVLREGHCGIPMAHRVPRGARVAYLRTMRQLGFGTHHLGKSSQQWAEDFDEYLEDWCHYRPVREVRAAYCRAGLDFENYESALAAFRLRGAGQERLAPFVERFPTATTWAVRALAHMVIISRPLAAR